MVLGGENCPSALVVWLSSGRGAQGSSESEPPPAWIGSPGGWECMTTGYNNRVFSGSGAGTLPQPFI